MILALCLIGWKTSAARADEAPDLRAVPLQAGEPAPFDGQLLTPELAIRLGQKAEGCEERINIEVRRVEALAVVPWWQSPPFVAAVSVASTAAVFVLVGAIR